MFSKTVFSSRGTCQLQGAVFIDVCVRIAGTQFRTRTMRVIVIFPSSGRDLCFCGFACSGWPLGPLSKYQSESARTLLEGASPPKEISKNSVSSAGMPQATAGRVAEDQCPIDISNRLLNGILDVITPKRSTPRRPKLLQTDHRALFQGTLACLLRTTGFLNVEVLSGMDGNSSNWKKKIGSILKFLPKGCEKLPKILAPSIKNGLN